MTIETTLNDTTATIVVSGKLTVATSPELEAEVQRLQGSATSFDIDLANLEYVSSAGLRVLVGAQKLASRAGGELRLASDEHETSFYGTLPRENMQGAA